LYPRQRLDAFGDAIFAVSMTLLALDVRLPDDLEPADSAALATAILALWPKFLPYALSFYVLGVRWLAMLRLRGGPEDYGPSYARYLLAFLFLVTCVPFTTTAVGQHASLAPAIWLYAGNTALIGLLSFALLRHTPGLTDKPARRDREVAQAMLVGSALIAIGWSFVDPRQALLALALNLLSPALIRLSRRAGAPRRAR
jgi:uncharacterized membrane protein